MMQLRRDATMTHGTFFTSYTAIACVEAQIAARNSHLDVAYHLREFSVHSSDCAIKAQQDAAYHARNAHIYLTRLLELLP